MESRQNESMRVAAQVGERIKAARMAAGLSAEDLAERLGTTKTTVCKWERAVHWPTAPQMVAIAAVLGVDVGSLYES